MIYIIKVGKNNYGNWACFSFDGENISISGIATTKLELQENKSYDNLLLKIFSKNGKIYYNILEK